MLGSCQFARIERRKPVPYTTGDDQHSPQLFRDAIECSGHGGGGAVSLRCAPPGFCVADLSLFHTEIQLITRDIVTVPNMVLTQNAVHVTRRGGTSVNVDVSIGYTVPHETVIAALKEAAEQAELGELFVLVEELLDHAIRYRVYGLLDDSSSLLTKTSDLRRAILSTLHRQQIEIASPSLTDRRSSDSSVAYVPPVATPDAAPNS